MRRLRLVLVILLTIGAWYLLAQWGNHLVGPLTEPDLSQTQNSPAVR